MGYENTITEQDVDAASLQVVNGLKGATGDGEPDLDVDGLSDSLLSKLLRLFGASRR